MFYELVCDVGDTHETVFVSASSKYQIEKEFLLLRGSEEQSRHRIGRVRQVNECPPVSNFIEIVDEIWIDCEKTSLDEYIGETISNSNSCQMVTTIFDGDKIKIYIIKS